MYMRSLTIGTCEAEHSRKAVEVKGTLPAELSTLHSTHARYVLHRYPDKVDKPDQASVHPSIHTLGLHSC